MDEGLIRDAAARVDEFRGEETDELLGVHRDDLEPVAQERARLAQSAAEDATNPVEAAANLAWLDGFMVGRETR